MFIGVCWVEAIGVDSFIVTLSLTFLGHQATQSWKQHAKPKFRKPTVRQRSIYASILFAIVVHQTPLGSPHAGVKSTFLSFLCPLCSWNPEVYYANVYIKVKLAVARNHHH